MQTTMEVEGIEMPLSEFRMLTQSELGSTGGISPELLSAVNKVSVKAIEAGYLNFRDFLKYVASEIGDALTAKLRPHFRDGWNRVRDSYDTKMDLATNEAGESDFSEATSDGRTGVAEARTASVGEMDEAADDVLGEPNLPATTSAVNDQRIVPSLKNSAATDADESQGKLFDPEEAGDPEVARSLLDQLLADSKVYKSTESYKSLLDFVVRLRNVAPFNAMLLQLQKPGLTYVASAHDWETRFQRRVKEDARPLLILWPFGPVATVYDVLDTFDPEKKDAEGLPENLARFAHGN